MKQSRLLALLFTSAVTCAPIATAHAQCVGDFNGDHVRDGLDLATLLTGWGGPNGDTNADGTTDGVDLSFILSGWGACPGPTWATVLEALPDPAIVTDLALRSAITATGLPWRVKDTGTNIEMLLVPAGSFTMGCSASLQWGCSDTENPLHIVTLTNAFYLARYEMTQAQWTAKMGRNPSFFQGPSYPDAAYRPVEQVSWNMIASFNTATGLRLPTEAEWEFAYRAQLGTSVTRTAFHNGTNDDALLGNIAWYGSNSGDQTHAVGGIKTANALGLYDMSGNVWEWINDWWSWNYSSSSPSTNPTGPSSGDYRVLRGGSCYDISNSCRGSRRSSDEPDYAYSNIGFRSARTAALQPPTISSVSPSSGSCGTAITITGTNFDVLTTVTVGGAAAPSVLVVSATSITAFTPLGTNGQKDVVVSTAAGTATATNAFTYTGSWYTVLEQLPDPAIVTDIVLRDAITATGLAWRVLDNGTNIEMLLIPPGSFTMGCTPSGQWECSGAENPTHAVTLTNAFYLGRYEVTQAQWTAKMGSNPSQFQGSNYPDAATRPVEMVSWNMIIAFNAASCLRLPTEAEWEYAYRAQMGTAVTRTAFHNDTNDDALLGNIAWFSGNNGASGTSTYGTKVVGGKTANALGLHDMSGNIHEWVNDWYSSSYYSSSPSTNPTGPSSGYSRVLRGGAWGGSSFFCLASKRSSSPPNATGSVGFRSARTP